MTTAVYCAQSWPFAAASYEAGITGMHGARRKTFQLVSLKQRPQKP